MHKQNLPRTTRVQIGGGSEALSAQRSALMSELTSLTIRRDLLSQQLRNATGSSVAELQEQLRNVDARVKATSAALDRVDEATEKAALAQTPATTPTAIGISGVDIGQVVRNALSSVPPAPASAARMDRLEKMVLGFGALNGLGLILMATVLWRTMRWPRSNPTVQAGQLDQLQRAVDVIALEVERISEGQRFVTKAIAKDRVEAPAESKR